MFPDRLGFFEWRAFSDCLIGAQEQVSLRSADRERICDGGEAFCHDESLNLGPAFEAVPGLIRLHWTAMHRLSELFNRLSRDIYPPRDDQVEILASPPGKTDAVVAFTSHHVIAGDIDPDLVSDQLDPDDPAAPMRATFLSWYAGQLDVRPGSLRVVLVAKGTGTGDTNLARREDLYGHIGVAPRLVNRENVELYSDQYGQSVLVLGDGLAGRRELSVQVPASQRRAGTGRQLVRSAIALTPAGLPLFAQVAAGNAASLRAFYNAGFRPVGAEVLFPKA